MKWPNIKGWFRRVRDAWQKQGTEEGKALAEELGKQVRRMIVGAFLALLLVVLGFPRLVAWYEDYQARQKNPPREVYIQLRVVETNSLTPIPEVNVQVAGDEWASGYTDAEGELVIPYEAKAGDNTINLMLTKEGFEPETEYKIALPSKEGDSTLLRTFQLAPQSAEKVRHQQPKRAPY
jgi:hypothetical protein